MATPFKPQDGCDHARLIRVVRGGEWVYICQRCGREFAALIEQRPEPPPAAA